MVIGLGQTCFWVFECLMQMHRSAVACCGHRGCGFSRLGKHNVWAPSQSHWVDNPKTEDQLYQISSHTVMKVLRPTTDFPTWGSSKGTENPQGIFPWRPVGFDYKTSMGLVKEPLRGHKQNLVHTRNQEKGTVTLTRDWGRLACECPWVPRGGMGQHGYCGVRGHWIQQSWHKPFGRRLPIPLP